MFQDGEKVVNGEDPSTGNSLPPSGPPGPQSQDGQSKSEPIGSDLIGKINNLMSTDLHNITEGRDFLVLVLYAPLQFLVCVGFLYKVLGWRWALGTPCQLGLLANLFVVHLLGWVWSSWRFRYPVRSSICHSTIRLSYFYLKQECLRSWWIK